MIKLFEGEKIVSQSNEDSIILTSHRICYEFSTWGNSYNQNIPLEHITSCENKATSLIILYQLALASLLISFGLGIDDIRAGVVGFVGFVFLIAIYRRTKKNLIIIASPSTKMEINVLGMEKEKILEFIDLIEETKHIRVRALNKEK